MSITEMVLLALGLEGLALIYILNQWANSIITEVDDTLLIDLVNQALGYARQQSAPPRSNDFYSHAGGYMALINRPLLSKLGLHVDTDEGKKKLMALLMAHDITHTVETNDE